MQKGHGAKSLRNKAHPKKATNQLIVLQDTYGSLGTLHTQPAYFRSSLCSPLRSSSKIVHVRPQPISRFRNLHLNIRLRSRIIRTVQLAIRLIHLQHIRTINAVRIPCPAQRTRARGPDISAGDPRCFLRRIGTAIDGRDQSIAERGDDRGAVAPGILFYHLRVPSRVEIRVRALP